MHLFYGYAYIGIAIWIIGAIVFGAISFILARKHKQVSFGTWADEMAFAGVRPIGESIIALSFNSTNGVAKTTF